MTVDELNAMAMDGSIDEFIRVCEARQVKELSRIADAVFARGGVRLVLLAGGSSAGKTTTAKRLCTQLRVNGFETLHFSTDDYFVGDARNPRDENGDFDYEHIDCVDAPRLAEDMNALFAGKRIRPRRFDFIRHAGYDAKEEIALSEGGLIVLEGIHALNPTLTRDIPDGCKYGVFAEPQPKLGFFSVPRLGARLCRLIRRIVRDNQFRKMPPAETFRIWPKVIAGEEKWILPFRDRADVVFDTSLDYEVAVLKPYVAGLIARALHDDPKNAVAQSLMEMLSEVLPVSPVAVPGDSILRETIGGSQLQY